MTNYQNSVMQSQQHTDYCFKHNPDMGHISDRMKAERARLGWSQDDLAEKAKISQSFIGALEARNQENSKWIPEIAYALGVDAYWLKTGKGERAPIGLPTLTAQQAKLIDAWDLIDSDARDLWVSLAEKKLEQREAIKRNAA